MLRFHLSRFGWILGLTLGCLAAVTQAQEFRYCYVSLDQVELPPGFDPFFDPIAINNSGRIYGHAFDDTSFLPHVAVYEDGAVSVLQPGIVNTVNEGGTIGGSVLIDPVNFIEQAALFRGDQVELIPPQPFEFTSFVRSLNDRGTGLVISFDSSFAQTNLFYQHGQATPLDFGPTVSNPFALRINNMELISGTQSTTSICEDATGFRFDTRTGETTLLYPLPTEPAAWGLDINNGGHVLGYSFVCGGIERIGVWDREGEFQTYFVEGIPQFPTISNRLLFNNNNLIVITFVSSPASERFTNSYLVPKPGMRLNLADLVENLPSGQTLFFIQDLNDSGNMIGFGDLGSFLLKRIDEDESCPTPAAATQALSGATDMRTASPAAAAMLRRRVPPALKSGSASVENPLLGTWGHSLD